jgi:hypothetical protein
MKISLTKTKTMAFHGKQSVRTKIVIDNYTLEHMTHFKYLGCDVSYQYDNHVDVKLKKFQNICGTIRRSLRGKTRKDTQLKFYKVMATPTLLYGSETWTLNARDKSRIQASEMKFLRSVKGCTREDKIRNEEIREELRIFNISEKIQGYHDRWVEHLERMVNGRFSREALHYTTKGRRDPGRPRKRWSRNRQPPKP